MSHELICTWLKLPPEKWPPTHYDLLGLPAAETDIQKIEECVHERLLLLRQYQLNHPDQATEAMNRVAQAFACLTDAAAKKSYDTLLLSPEAPAEPPPEAPEVEPLVFSADEPDPLAWLFGAWSRGGPEDGVGDAPAAEPALPPEFSAVPLKSVDWNKEPPPARLVPAPLPPATTPLPAAAAAAPGSAHDVGAIPAEERRADDLIAAAARYSRWARRGLGTTRALYHRIAHTRELLWHWEQLGKYLGKPTKRLTRLSEATELSRHLGAVLELLSGFPPLLGNAGQPGYLVIVLARQPQIVPTFRTLLLQQREILAQHWRDGRELLVQHRRFLREELRTMRAKSPVGRWMRASYAAIADQPEALLLLLALLALNLALWSHFMN